MTGVGEPSPAVPGEVLDRLLLFAEQTDDFIGVTDDAGNIIYVNPAARKRMGLTGDDPPALTTADVFPPEAFDIYFEKVRPALLRGEGWRGEVPVRLAGGATMDVEMSVLGGIGPGGEVSWLVTVARDLTELHRRSLYDELTAVARRAVLLDRMELALRRVERDGGLLALIFLDVDGMKSINDTFGHRTGDAVLADTAARVVSAVRGSDTVARVGGDEFAVLLDGVHDDDEALALTQRVQGLVEGDPIRAGDAVVRVSVSIGVSVGGTGTTAEQLLDRADTAMYESKRRRLDDRREPRPSALGSRGSSAAGVTAHELAVALTQRRIGARLEPVAVLTTGSVVGYHATPEWHRETGVLPADAFTYVAEGSGMSSALNLAVLRGAVRAARGLDQLVPPRLYVGLSARFLSEPRMPYLVEELLSGELFDPARLYVVIQEQLVARRTPGLVDALEALRGHGSHLVVSDVGAHSPPILDLADGIAVALRIDRRIVAGVVEDPAVARAVSGIVGLSHGMGLEVIAAGVDTRAQRDLLVQLDCDLGEGAAVD